jgi:hypothetical protein
VRSYTTTKHTRKAQSSTNYQAHKVHTRTNTHTRIVQPYAFVVVADTSARDIFPVWSHVVLFLLQGGYNGAVDEKSFSGQRKAAGASANASASGSGSSTPIGTTIASSRYKGLVTLDLSHNPLTSYSVYRYGYGYGRQSEGGGNRGHNRTSTSGDVTSATGVSAQGSSGGSSNNSGNSSGMVQVAAALRTNHGLASLGLHGCGLGGGWTAPIQQYMDAQVGRWVGALLLFIP